MYFLINPFSFRPVHNFAMGATLWSEKSQRASNWFDGMGLWESTSFILNYKLGPGTSHPYRLESQTNNLCWFTLRTEFSHSSKFLLCGKRKRERWNLVAIQQQAISYHTPHTNWPNRGWLPWRSYTNLEGWNGAPSIAEQLHMYI